MSKGVDGVGEAGPDGLGGVVRRIVRIIGKLPAVADVHVKADRHDDVATSVADGAPMRRLPTSLDLGANQLTALPTEVYTSAVSLTFLCVNCPAAAAPAPASFFSECCC